MSRAFTSEDDTDGPLADIGERPVSDTPQPGDAGRAGQIDADGRRVARRAGQGRSRRGPLAHRHRFARPALLVGAPRDGRSVGAGAGQRGRPLRHDRDARGRRRHARKTWTIVGEDEADAASGTISHASPMAVALFGKSVGDVVTVGGREWEVVAIGSEFVRGQRKARRAGICQRRSAAANCNQTGRIATCDLSGLPDSEPGALAFLVAGDDVPAADGRRQVLLALEVALDDVAAHQQAAPVRLGLDVAIDRIVGRGKGAVRSSRA